MQKPKTDFCWYKSLRITLDRKFRGANFREWEIFRKKYTQYILENQIVVYESHIWITSVYKNVLYVCLFYISAKDKKYLQKSHKKP